MDKHNSISKGKKSNNFRTLQSQSTSKIKKRTETLNILSELSELLDVGLDQAALSAIMDLLDAGIHPEALAAVVIELRKEADNADAAHADA